MEFIYKDSDLFESIIFDKSPKRQVKSQFLWRVKFQIQKKEEKKEAKKRGKWCKTMRKIYMI